MDKGGVLLSVERDGDALLLRVDPGMSIPESPSDTAEVLRYRFTECARPARLAQRLSALLGEFVEWETDTWADGSVHRTFFADWGRHRFEAVWANCEQLEGGVRTAEDVRKGVTNWRREAGRLYDQISDEKERAARYLGRINALETKVRQEIDRSQRRRDFFAETKPERVPVAEAKLEVYRRLQRFLRENTS